MHAGTRCAAAGRVARSDRSSRRTSRRAPRTSPPAASAPLPSATTPSYRSAPRPAAAIAVSFDIAASTRGSSCATSAQTRIQPSSARTAGRRLRRDLQRPAAAGRPAARHDTAGQIDRPEPLPVHPLGQPRPAVRRVQPRELLVRQQRLDHGVFDLAQLPARRGVHQDPGPPQGLQQARRTVRVDRGILERVGDPGRELRHPDGTRTGHRTGPERLAEQTIVLRRAPRQPGGSHLLRDQRAGRLGRAEQREAAVGGATERGPLPRVLRHQLVDLRILVRSLVQREQRGRLRTGQRVHADPARGRRDRVGQARRVAEDRVTQQQIVRPADPHPRVEQLGIDVAQRAHDPARVGGALPGRDGLREIPGGDGLPAQLRAVAVEQHRGPAV